MPSKASSGICRCGLELTYKLEMVQRRAARYTCNRFHNTSSVSEMIDHLGWESLAVRQNNMRPQMMYRISRKPAGDAWQRWLTMSTRQTRGFHPWRYIPLSPSNNIFKFSIFARHHSHMEQPPIRGCFCPKYPHLPPLSH